MPSPWRPQPRCKPLHLRRMIHQRLPARRLPTPGQGAAGSVGHPGAFLPVWDGGLCPCGWLLSSAAASDQGWQLRCGRWNQCRSVPARRLAGFAPQSTTADRASAALSAWPCRFLAGGSGCCCLSCARQVRVKGQPLSQSGSDRPLVSDALRLIVCCLCVPQELRRLRRAMSRCNRPRL